MEDKLKFIEVINTYQGEGPDSGRQMLLLRFKECDRVVNKKTCPWCDTVVKMRVIEAGSYTLREVNKLVWKTKGIMITGGEPLFKPNYQSTLDILYHCDFDIVNIETNGCTLVDFIAHLEENLLFKQKIETNKIKIIYSPKIFNEEDYGIELVRTSHIISKRMVFIKLVIGKESRLVEDYLNEVKDMNPRKNQIWLMPEGTTRNDLIVHSGKVMDLCEEYECNFSSRNHIIYEFV